MDVPILKDGIKNNNQSCESIIKSICEKLGNALAEQVIGTNL